MLQTERIIQFKTFCAAVILKAINLPVRFLNFLKRNYRIFRNKQLSKKRENPLLFLIGTPNHGNLGDQLIAVGELEWFRDKYSDYELREFSHEELMKDKNCRLLLSQIKKEDLIFLHGGGNLNVLYLNCERIRRKIISECPDNKIVLLQQSIFYEDTQKGREVKQETQRIYNRHKNFTVIARENGSFKVAKEIFTALRILKYPDMATYLFGKITASEVKKRNGIIMCIRKDKEKFYSASEIEGMYKKLSQNYSLTFSDTHIGRSVLPENRFKEIQNLIDKISKHKVTVTDRFHGVVFSILSRTPCVVLRSSDHKIVDGVKWFADCEGIYYAENIDEVPALVEKASKVNAFKAPDFTHYFDDLYNELNK